MASSLLNKLKLIAGESIDTTDPIDPDNPYKYIDKYIKEYGITNPYIINAIKGVISSEGGVEGRPEASYANTSAERIKKIFGARAAKYTDEELNVIKKDPVRFYDMLYGPEAMPYYTDRKTGAWNPGNDQPGDGYKYRGRGLNQLTFKSSYKEVSDRLKKKGYDIDLVKNPEILDSDPEIQALVAVDFMVNRLNKLSNSNSNVYKKKREQYNVDNWKDIDDQKTASLVLANVQSGFGDTPRKEYQENVYNASLKFIPVQPTEGSRADLVAEKTNQAIEQPDVEEILADIKYKPQVPKMPFGTSEKDVQNYLAEKQAYEQKALDQDLSVEELGAQELAAYEASPRSFDTFENMAQNTPPAEPATASGNFENTMTDEEYNVLDIKKPFSEPQIFKLDVQDIPEVSVIRNKKEETIPLVEPKVDENKYDNLEFLNTLHQPRSIISEGSFTNEARSKEKLKQDAAAENFIMDPLQKNIKSGYFGSGKSMFYPSTRQQKYGGSMAPIIPTYYKSKGTPIYRDTTSLPFDNGGPLDEESVKNNSSLGRGTKGFIGAILDASKLKHAREASKTEVPKKQEGTTDYDYFSSLTVPQKASIPYKEQMSRRDVESENYHVNQVRDNMLNIASKLEGMDMKEDYEYLGVPWMGQQNIKQIGDGIDENVKIIDDTSSWFHKIPSEYYTGYQNEAGENVLSPYTCIGSYCAIGAKAGARFAEDTKYGKAGEPWKVLTGNYQVDDIEEEMGLYQKDAKDIEKGDAVRQNRDQGTSHTMLVTGMPDESGRYHTTYGSGWKRGVFSDNWANIGWAQGEDNPMGNDVIVGYEGRLPLLQKGLSKAESLNNKYQEYLDKKTIAKLPIKEIKSIRTGPVKVPYIPKKEYPNTRRGRKQEKQDNAYIEAYMARMQKK